jgi:hypothetical protein
VSDVGQFRHLQAFAALSGEVYHINERIITGDYARAKFALPHVERLIRDYSVLMTTDGADEISIKPYVGAGDCIGLTFSYRIGEVTVEGSFIPRRP